MFCSPGAYFTAPVSAVRVSRTDLYNFAVDNYLMVPQERYLVGGYADYEFKDGHTAYIEGTFVNNRVAKTGPDTGDGYIQRKHQHRFAVPVGRQHRALRLLDATAATGNTVGDGIVPLAIQRRINEAGRRNSLDERTRSVCWQACVATSPTG